MYIPFKVQQATKRLGWEIVSVQPDTADGTVYVCRLQDGLAEPCTEAVILDQLQRLEAIAALFEAPSRMMLALSSARVEVV